MLIRRSMYQSTIFGTSRRPRAPPKAVPFQVRPVTSWNGRVDISWPAPATPMITLVPHPRALHDVQADTAEAEDDDAIAGLHLCGVKDRADSGRDAASDVTNLFEW